MNDKRVLIIEDEFLVAIELQSILKAAGFLDVVHAATESEALDCLAQGRWSAAIADANLNGQGITKIAAALRERQVPFVIVTGYGREQLPPEVATVPMLEKPVSKSRLVQTVWELCGHSERSTHRLPKASG